MKLDQLRIARKSKDEEVKSKVKVIKWRVVEGAEDEEEEGKKEPTREELEELFPIKETDEEEEEEDAAAAAEEVDKDAETARGRELGAVPRRPSTSFRSRISQQLETMPPPPENPFKEYAKFAGVNGAALQGAKSINIFLVRKSTWKVFH